MKRKIIKLGQATFVMSLPSAWIRKFDLKQGDYLEVEEAERTLVVASEKQIKNAAIKFDLRKVNSDLVESFVLGAYRQGYDEIELVHEPQCLEYKSKKKLSTTKLIQEIVNVNLVGAEIIEQSSQRTVIRDLGGSSGENVDNVFQRSLHLLKMNARDCLNALKNKDLEVLSSMELRHKNMKKFLLFYERLINKKTLSKEKSTPIQQLTARLVDISASYKHLADEVVRTGKFYSPIILDVLEKLDASLAQVVSACLEFNQAKYIDFVSEREQLWEKIYQLKLTGVDYLSLLCIGPLLLNLKKAMLYRFSMEI